MTTDLVPVDNMAALDALDPATRELAVTNMLTEARSWLAHAMEATEPQTIANFKAQMATVAEATKQLGLSKEIQLDAQEMVRRAERGVGVAIREGQAAGEVGSKRTNGMIRQQTADATLLVSPKSLVSHSHETVAIYAMTDDVSDEQFESALTDAKAEGNLSRANVVRKVRGGTLVNRRARADIIGHLAAQGYSSRQMPAKVGVTEETVRLIAREYGIDIPADKAVSHTRRLDHTHMVESTVTSLENSVDALKYIDLAEVDWSEADEWVASLTNSIRALNRFKQQIKETTHV